MAKTPTTIVENEMKQLHLSSAQNLIEEIAPVVNSDVIGVKPRYGFWTSTWNEEDQSSAWIDWCRDASYGEPAKQQWFLLSPLPTANIYTIDSHADFMVLLKKYRRKFPGDDIIRTINPAYLDYEQISHDYDAIHLTEKGEDETRFTNWGLYGWDCESTLWFRWVFAEVEKIGVPTT